ncbi:unnamed protein product [Rhodiola kirilowii]
MEQLGAMCEGEWLSGMYATTNEESEFMTQLIDELSPASVLGGECLGLLGVQSNFWDGHTSANVASRVNYDSFVYSSDPSSSNVCISSQETTTYSGSDGDGDMTNLLFSSSQGAYYQLGDSNQSFANNDNSCYYNSVDFGFEEDENASSTAFICTDFMMQLDEDSAQQKNNTKAEAEDDENLPHAAAYQETKIEIQLLDDAVKGKYTSPPADSKKRSRNFEAPKNKRNVKPRRAKKVSEQTNVDEEKSSCGLDRQITISNCSKDDTSAASEINNGEISSLTVEDIAAPSRGNGKTRANRGSATDPQSLYARKRREKINERLRILQGLVPNGTKVDISTMLDEAVQYVKFLQLQIKLLSSDDMWMYAPLAYNGMDLGLDIKI